MLKIPRVNTQISYSERGEKHEHSGHCKQQSKTKHLSYYLGRSMPPMVCVYRRKSGTQRRRRICRFLFRNILRKRKRISGTDEKHEIINIIQNIQ